MSEQRPEPSPQLIFETLNAYQRTEALKTAIELDLFTAIAEGHSTAAKLAQHCEVAERGVRILADFLTILGFLLKEGDRYELTPDSALFLDRRSPAYMGNAWEFLLSPEMRQSFAALTDAVRRGGTATSAEGTISTENPVWVRFAQSMAPIMAPAARQMTEIVPVEAGRKLRILDIAAGHGLFGIAFAERYPQAEVTALDWPAVLEVARQNSRAAGVSDRYTLLPGDALEVEYGTGYDLILLTNFLHHFDPETNIRLLRKVHAALADGGSAVTLEFIPNEDRVTPPGAASFSLIMLGTTPAGDAYTFAEFEEMFRSAGFSGSELCSLRPGMESAIISRK